MKHFILTLLALLFYCSVFSQTNDSVAGNHNLSVFVNGLSYRSFDGNAQPALGFGCKLSREMNRHLLIEFGYRNAYIDEVISTEHHNFWGNWFSLAIGASIYRNKFRCNLLAGPSIGKNLGLDCSASLNYFLKPRLGCSFSVVTTFYRSSQFSASKGVYTEPLSTNSLLQLQAGLVWRFTAR